MHKNLIKFNNKNRVKMGKGNRHFFQRQNPNRQQVHEKMLNITNYYVLYCSVAQLCLTVYDSMDCRQQASLSFTISLSLLKCMSISWYCHPTISSSVVPFSSCLQSFPASGSFPMSWFFTSGGQSIGESLGKYKTTVRDRLTPVRMTNIKKTREKS